MALWCPICFSRVRQVNHDPPTLHCDACGRDIPFEDIVDDGTLAPD